MHLSWECGQGCRGVGRCPLRLCRWFGAQVWDERFRGVERLWDMRSHRVGTAGTGALGARAASTAGPQSKRPAWNIWEAVVAPARPGDMKHLITWLPHRALSGTSTFSASPCRGTARHQRSRQGSPLNLSTSAVPVPFSACDTFLLSLLGKKEKEIRSFHARLHRADLSEPTEWHP